MARTYWAIVDRDNCVVGEWMGQSHYVACYEKYHQAKLAALAYKIPDFTIANAQWAALLPPSEHSLPF